MSDLIDRAAVQREIQNSFNAGAFRWQDGQDLMDRINALPAAPRWVRCEERLPKDGETVLIYCETTGGIVKSHFREIDGRTGKLILFSGGTHHPTHWMPIEPPKEGE